VSKYHARPVEADGYRFDSQAEYRRYCELKLLQSAGEIQGLQVHPKFPLLPADVVQDGTRLRAIVYEGDFSYRETAYGKLVCEDVKGVRTPVFILKANLFRRTWPEWELREVKP